MRISYKSILKQHKFPMLAGTLCLLVTDSAQLAVPKIIQNCIDLMVENRELAERELYRIFFILLVLAVGIFVFRFFWRYFTFGASWKISRDLRAELFRHYEKMSPSFYRRNDTGELLALATNDVEAVRISTAMGLIGLVDFVYLTAISLGMMVSINLKLSLLALIPMPAIAFFVMKFGRKIHKRFDDVQKGFAVMSGQAREVFSGIRVVKAFVLEKFQGDKFAGSSRDYVDKNIRLSWIWGTFFPLVMLFSEISSLVILWAGGFMVMGKDITLGEFVAFNSYIGILTWPMMAVGFITNLYQRGSASMDRLNQILMEQPEITDSPGARPMQKVRGHIEIKNLTFSYGKELMEPALRNMWLEIEAGETVAITGRIGSGKSTLIKLLTRLYDPPGGKIFLDGVDILEVQLKDLRNAISVVPQIPFLFSEKIGVNVELGNPESTAERVNEIIGIVKLEEGTRHNGIGYDTLVGERGITLSGGQKQRVTIARGLIKDSQILILDDVLSSVDTRTEDEILSALPSMISGRTTIIISHRVSALKVARRIYVFEKGRVAELGTHEELSHSGGYYSELCRKQRLAQFGLR